MYTSKNIQRFPLINHGELEIEKNVFDQVRLGGVYRVVARNGEIAHYSTSWDLQRAKAHNLRQLILGKHVHHWLQKEYETYDLRGIRFEIVEVVRRPKKRLVLPQINGVDKKDWRKGRSKRRGVRKWNHRGGDQVNGSPSAWVGGLPPPESLPVQVFTYDDYEKILAKKLKKHHVKYLQQRLNVLLRGYNRKQVIPRWHIWKEALYNVKKVERNAAAKQVQRLYRGRKTRQALFRWKVKQSILQIQCAFRCHQAWLKVSKKRWEIVSYMTACVIQRGYRAYVSRALGRVFLSHMKKRKCSIEIQRIWRGKVGRARHFHARLVKSAIKIQCRWRIKKGGLALHLKRQHARQVKESQNSAAICIQCWIRQWFARAIRDDKEYERLVQAAIRIQCRWRIKQGGLALHLKRQAKEQERLELIELENAAIRVQATWRRKQGQFALHLKRQARKQALLQEEEEETACIKIQHWWSIITGTYAAKLTLRAKRQTKKEKMQKDQAMELAALRVQSMWRRRQGGLALHLKRQAHALVEKENKKASQIQLWWHNIQGNIAAKIKARAIVQTRKEEIEAETRLKYRNDNAHKLQVWWSRVTGGFAAKMKARAKMQLRREEIKREKTRQGAAHKLQVWWSRVTGGFAAKMKARAKMQLRREEIKREKAAHKLQIWWSHVTGGFAAKMKARAKMQLRREEIEREKAAHKLQIWWSHVTGGFAAKMKARAKMQLRREEIEREKAAHKLQIWWSHVTGGFAAKMKARAQIQVIKEERAAHQLQLWWHRVNGTFAQRIKERARAEIEAEWRERESAALRVQSRWRAKKGQLSYHLKQKALRRLANTADDWLKYKDEWTLQPSYYSAMLDRTVYFEPDSYIHPGNWYEMVDEETKSIYYVKYKKEDEPLWLDCGLTLDTEDLEQECLSRGLIGEGLGRTEYIEQLRSWLNDINNHESSWELPPGADLVDTPKVPKPPRNYLKINGYWRRQKRQGLSPAKKYYNNKPNLKRFVFNDLHPKKAKLMNKIAFERRQSQVDLKKQIQEQLKREEQENARLAEEQSRKHVSPLKSKDDLHEYVVKTFARRQRRLNPLKVKYQTVIEKGDRVKLKNFVGGFVSLKTVVRYYPGTVVRVRKYEHTETFDILLDDGAKRTGARRDQILLEFQDEPDEEERRLLEEEVEEEKEKAPTFAEIANTKKMVGNLLATLGRLPANDPRMENKLKSRGSTRGSDASSNQDGLHMALKTKLEKKRKELISRGSVPSRASSRMRTPGPS